MTDTNRINEQKTLIEKFGAYFESLGFQPIAGRITGLLIVSDNEQLSFDEITNELNISKGSASTVLRSLQENGSVNCITNEGERRHYYQINTQNLFKLLDDFEKKCLDVRQLLNSAFNLKKDKDANNSVFCKKMIKTLDYYRDSLSVLRQELANA